MIIKTPRLILREFQHSDIASAHSLFSDPIVMKFSLNGPYTEEKSTTFIAQCMLKSKNNEPSLLAVIDKKTNKLIGSCGFFPQTIQGTAELELGYRFMQSHWGKGLATEATTALKNHAFDNMGLTRLISLIDINNVASLRVAEKNGFVLEKQMIYNGQFSIGLYASIK